VSEQAAMWWGGGLCDYCVSPSPFSLDFGTLDFGTSDLGLTMNYITINCAGFFDLLVLLDLRILINKSKQCSRFNAMPKLLVLLKQYRIVSVSYLFI